MLMTKPQMYGLLASSHALITLGAFLLAGPWALVVSGAVLFVTAFSSNSEE